MSRFRQILLFVLVALAALASGFFLNPGVRPGAVDAGGLLTASLPDLSGVPRVVGHWKGKVMVVNFWGTWCPPCLEEIPEFVRMQERLGDKGLQFLGIAVDDREKVRAFAASHQINYPVLVGELDAIELSRKAGNARGGLPYTLVIDRSGQVVSQHYGGLTEAKLDPIVTPLL